MGKFFKYKGMPDNTAKELINEDKNFYHFSDGTRTHKTAFDNLFEEVGNFSLSLENNQQNQGEVNQNSVQQENQMQTSHQGNQPEYDSTIDPSSFWNEDERFSLYEDMKNNPEKYKDIQKQFEEEKPDKIIDRDKGVINNSKSYESPYGSEVEKAPIQKEMDEKMAGKGFSGYDTSKIQNQQPSSYEDESINESSEKMSYIPYDYHFEPISDEEKQFFSKFKTNNKVTLKLDIVEYLPDFDFLKMMNNNFETSIIEYYSQEFTKSLLDDPSFLKEEIKRQLEEAVFNNKKTRKRSTTNSVNNKSSSSANKNQSNKNSNSNNNNTTKSNTTKSKTNTNAKTNTKKNNTTKTTQQKNKENQQKDESNVKSPAPPKKNNYTRNVNIERKSPNSGVRRIETPQEELVDEQNTGEVPTNSLSEETLRILEEQKRNG